MDVELIEIQEFLSRHAPFDTLPVPVLETIPRTLVARYFRRDTAIANVGDATDRVSIVRSGAAEIRDADGTLVDVCGPGDTFGAATLLRGPVAKHSFITIEDTLVLEMPAGVFHRLLEESPDFKRFYQGQMTERLRTAVERAQTSQRGKAVLKTPARDLLRRAPLTVDPQASAQEASIVMRDHGVSSLLVVDNASEPQEGTGGITGDLVGIVTDRDLRNRVLAAGLASDVPVTEIMSPEPATATPDDYAFQLLMEMVSRNIHHIPVVDPHDEHRILGLISSTDLMRLEQASPVYLVGDIRKQSSVEGISDLAARLPEVLEQLVSQDATATEIGHVITAVGDAAERRLLELAEAELGPAPLPYCWVVLGSQARLEQGLSSDQDNAMIISDELGTEESNPDYQAQAAYFAELATRVSDGLAACGYRYCDGDVMATNPRWRQTLAGWGEVFDEWINNPTAEALMNASIFFDMRVVHGDFTLFESLRNKVLTQTPTAKRFLTHMTRNSLLHVPPLGFFRGFVLEKEKDNRSTLNLKHKGTVPIIDLARVHALAAGIPAVNTSARLRTVMANGRIGRDTGTDLLDALEFITHIRWDHQSRQVRAGRTADNFVSPDELSDFERRHLKDAFAVVKHAQQSLAQAYPQAYVS